jgi:hypothetical protein
MNFRMPIIIHRDRDKDGRRKLVVTWFGLAWGQGLAKAGYF